MVKMRPYWNEVTFIATAPAIARMSVLLSLRPSSALLDKHEKAVNSKRADRESQKADIPLGSLRISGFAYWLQPEQLWKKEGLLGDSSRRPSSLLVLCVGGLVRAA